MGPPSEREREGRKAGRKAGRQAGVGEGGGGETECLHKELIRQSNSGTCCLERCCLHP